jgi:hypothetical protein
MVCPGGSCSESRNRGVSGCSPEGGKVSMRLRRNCRRASARRLDIMCARQNPITRSTTTVRTIAAFGMKLTVALPRQCASRPLRTLQGTMKRRLNLSLRARPPLGSRDRACDDGGKGKEINGASECCSKKARLVVLEFWRGNPINRGRRGSRLPWRFLGTPLRFARCDAESGRGAFDQRWGLRLARCSRQRSY